MSVENTNGTPRKRRRRKPSLEQLAEAGDVDGLFQMMTSSYWTLIDTQSAFQQLYRAITVAHSRDPAAFSRSVFRNIISFNAYLLMRVQVQIAKIIAAQDPERDAQQSDYNPAKVLDEKTMQYLCMLQRQVTDLLEQEARINRQWELIRDKRGRNNARDRTLPPWEPIQEHQDMPPDVISLLRRSQGGVER